MSQPSRWSTLSLYLIAVLAASSTTSAQDDSRACYFREGNFAKGYVQCPGANGTKSDACCYSAGWPHIDPCFSNGFCFSTEVGVVYRGGCADQGWGSLDCVQSCPTVNVAGTAMLSFCQDQSLCCTAVDDAENKDCCQNGTVGDGKFAWDDATFTGHVNASTLYDVYDSRQAISGAYTNSSTSNDTSSTSTGEENDNTVSQGTVIGVGVGLGIPLLIALATCAWLFLSLRKERSKGREAYSSIDDPKHSHGGNDLSPGPSQDDASRVASQDRTLSSQGNLHPSMNGYAAETKAPGYMWPPQPQPPMQQAPAELSNERTPVEVQS
ncbi:hypothetical protein PRZ48_006070 [Zasmidium cellare]|uniref:Mid2 domain-containing protein n=1 Tax=Zasmidium cellare TaxID=395010 RepID=A0ABR0EM45_ZASCE|nr:hypothetical protein PRZ48_006070 [Zasmidium cellare]